MRQLAFVILCLAFAGAAQPAAPTASAYAFPHIPDSISGEADRTMFLIRHFWDASPAEAIAEPAVFETFLYATSKADSITRREVLTDLLDRSAVNPDVFHILTYLIDWHIGSPDGAFWDDEVYIHLMKHIVDSDLPDEYKLAPKWKIELLERNSVGTTAPDFRYIDRCGRPHEFYSEKSPCILVFADSGCTTCQTELRQYAPDLVPAVEAGWKLIVVYLNGEIPQYASAISAITPVADTDNAILANDLYVVRRLPSVYFINTDKQILARELKLHDTLYELNRLTSTQ